MEGLINREEWVGRGEGEVWDRGLGKGRRERRQGVRVRLFLCPVARPSFNPAMGVGGEGWRRAVLILGVGTYFLGINDTKSCSP
jgi:hypothetical protein